MSAQVLNTDFPDQEMLIAALRRNNPVFEAICRDYEEMLNELEELEAKGAEADKDWLIEMRETLDALHEEISNVLKRNAPVGRSGLRDRNT